MPSTKNFQPGDYIFKEGETGGYAYLLEEGSVEIVKLTPKGLSSGYASKRVIIRRDGNH